MTVCRECSVGIHTHMAARTESWFDELSRFDKRDQLDCKNIIGPNDQCVCPEWQRYLKST